MVSTAVSIVANPDAYVECPKLADYRPTQSPHLNPLTAIPTSAPSSEAAVHVALLWVTKPRKPCLITDGLGNLLFKRSTAINLPGSLSPLSPYRETLAVRAA